MFRDEVDFGLNGYVNKQNLEQEYPHEHEETLLDSEEVTVWCAINAGGVLNLP